MARFDIGHIQQMLCDIFSGIGEDVKLNLVPKASPERLDSYVLISMKNRIMDYGAYARTTVIISAVAKNKQPGIENGTEINRMVNEILSRFPVTNGTFSLITPEVSPFKGITGFSYANIIADMIIK